MTIPKENSFSYRLYEVFVLNPNVPIDTRPLQREVGAIRFFRRLYAARARYQWDIVKLNPGTNDGLFVYRPDGDGPARATAKIALPNSAELTIQSVDYWRFAAKEKLIREFDAFCDRLTRAPRVSFVFIEVLLPLPDPHEGGPIPIDPTAEVVFSAD